MVEIAWSLFHETFPEEIFPRKEIEQIITEPVKDDQDSPEFSDVLREVYYVTALKAISAPEYAQRYPEYLESLNSFDASLGLFMDSWKGNLRDLETLYAQIEPNPPKRLEYAAKQFSKEVLSCLRKNGEKSKNISMRIQSQLAENLPDTTIGTRFCTEMTLHGHGQPL